MATPSGAAQRPRLGLSQSSLPLGTQAAGGALVAGTQEGVRALSGTSRQELSERFWSLRKSRAFGAGRGQNASPHTLNVGKSHQHPVPPCPALKSEVDNCIEGDTRIRGANLVEPDPSSACDVAMALCVVLGGGPRCGSTVASGLDRPGQSPAVCFRSCDVQAVSCLQQASVSPGERGPPETKHQAVWRGTDRRPPWQCHLHSRSCAAFFSSQAAHLVLLSVGALHEMGLPEQFVCHLINPLSSAGLSSRNPLCSCLWSPILASCCTGLPEVEANPGECGWPICPCTCWPDTCQDGHLSLLKTPAPSPFMVLNVWVLHMCCDILGNEGHSPIRSF
ncbi:hypothetical protein P7K49_039632 [Saguinus oedipus]|uniref:Uncharacterized protein n=1 Tax=Saguinus oedipus TaxID=9490 RepID=A0ABQ9TBD5_SAGOE|nr:hypothetical protein P7K49_039632 [Saguinus oedipus]